MCLRVVLCARSDEASNRNAGYSEADVCEPGRRVLVVPIACPVTELRFSTTKERHRWEAAHSVEVPLSVATQPFSWRRVPSTHLRLPV